MRDEHRVEPRPPGSAQRPGPRRRRRWPYVVLGALVALLVLLGAARLALEPLVARRTHEALDRMRGLRGTFSRVEVSVLHLSYVIHDLRVDQLTVRGTPLPLVRVERAEAGLYGKELLHGHLVAAVTVLHPKLYVLTGAPTPRKSEKQPLDLAKALQAAAPLRIDRAEVRDGEVLWVDETKPERPRIWVHGIEATVENFASRAALGRGEPSVLALSGTLQRTGKLSVFASADPLAKGLTFAGEARLQGLALPELGEVLTATAGVTPTQGTLDCSVRFRALDGHLTGGIRPVLRNASVRQAKPGFGEKLKALLADLTLDLFSDRVPGRNAVATTVPIDGRVDAPGTQVWSTVLGVVRNAFVSGIVDGVQGLPPGQGGHGQEGAAQRAQARRPGGERGGR